MKTILIIISTILFSLTISAQNATNSIHFGFDVYKLSKANKEALREYVSQLEGTEIVLKGYTDFIGSNNYNDKLSNKRVNSVKAYLLQQGIKEESIKQTIGLGELTEFNDRKKNRRVDIFITTKTAEMIKVVEKEIIEDKDPVLSIEKINSLEVGESIALKGMEFIPGRHILQEYSKATLVELLSIMKTKSNLKIEIQGHICCDYSGNDGLDWDTQTKNLSENRAKHVYEYLIQEGISTKRLKYKGFGSSKPLVEEITKADQQRNRRVEIMILAK
jgi:outer membrane protein OmpA-like peptidoglycan-associated protein